MVCSYNPGVLLSVHVFWCIDHVLLIQQVYTKCIQVKYKICLKYYVTLTLINNFLLGNNDYKLQNRLHVAKTWSKKNLKSVLYFYPFSRDSMIVTTLDTFTSLISGITIFGILGNLAFQMGEDDISTIIRGGGSSLAFVSYPDAIAQSPFVPQVRNYFVYFLKLST